MKMYVDFIKPLCDRFIASLFLVVLSPVFLCIALLLTIQNRGTPFFRHTRIGKDRRAFKVIKFKTMRDLRGADGERSEEHTSELQSRGHLVCRLLLEKKK